MHRNLPMCTHAVDEGWNETTFEPLLPAALDDVPGSAVWWSSRVFSSVVECLSEFLLQGGGSGGSRTRKRSKTWCMSMLLET